MWFRDVWNPQKSGDTTCGPGVAQLWYKNSYLYLPHTLFPAFLSNGTLKTRIRHTVLPLGDYCTVWMPEPKSPCPSYWLQVLLPVWVRRQPQEDSKVFLWHWTFIWVNFHTSYSSYILGWYAVNNTALSTVVPRLTMIIRSSKIAVQWNHRQAKVKKPIEMHWKPFSVFQWAKYLTIQQRSSIGRPFTSACKVRKHSGEPFCIVGSHLENPTISCFDCHKRKLGSRSREPIIMKRIFPIQSSFCDHNSDRKKHIVKWFHHKTG